MSVHLLKCGVVHNRYLVLKTTYTLAPTIIVIATPLDFIIIKLGCLKVVEVI
jgi:hypothetical protein